MSVHNGHRQRMRQRFLKHGLDNFEDHELLEILLYYCVPRYDTNVIAHRLVDRFGSLFQVIDAPIHELEKVEGVGPNIAAFLSLIKATHKRLGIAKVRQNAMMETIDQYAEYLKNLFMGIHNEAAYLMCLDAKRMLIDCCLISEGSVSTVNVSTRKVVEIALNTKATTVILAHNHPGGLAIPSEDDLQTTKMLAHALYLTGVVLADHVILTENSFVSMRRSKMFDFEQLW